MTTKTLRQRIAESASITCLDALLHPVNIGRTFEITRHQKNALRIDRDGSPYWVSLDILEPLGETAFAVIGGNNGAHAGETLAIYTLAA